VLSWSRKERAGNETIPILLKFAYRTTNAQLVENTNPNGHARQNMSVAVKSAVINSTMKIVQSKIGQ